MGRRDRLLGTRRRAVPLAGDKNYMYQVREGFSIGEQPALQPGTMGWCIARNIERWGWQ